MSTQSIRILQANLIRRKDSHDIAHATAIEKGVLVSEPNKKLVSSSNWIKDKRLDVAVNFLNKKLEVLNIRAEEGFVCIHLRDYRIYGRYISLNISLDQFKASTDATINDSKAKKGKSIILGDLNAKFSEWDSPKIDARGKYWTEQMITTDMVVHNTNEIPTFFRGNTESFIRVACSTQKIAARIAEWKVLAQESLSDHRFIYFEIKRLKGRRRTNVERTKVENDWELFRKVFQWKLNSTDLEIKRNKHRKLA